MTMIYDHINDALIERELIDRCLSGIDALIDNYSDKGDMIDIPALEAQAETLRAERSALNKQIKTMRAISWASERAPHSKPMIAEYGDEIIITLQSRING